MTCRKCPHVDEGSAHRQLRQLKDKGTENKKQLNKLGVYRCECGHWHVGHNRYKGKQYDRPLQHAD